MKFDRNPVHSRLDRVKINFEQRSFVIHSGRYGNLLFLTLSQSHTPKKFGTISLGLISSLRYQRTV